MNISHFDDLLHAARAQPMPQRLLLVFASTELPDDCTPQQRADFLAGYGGALLPQMCVDKSPAELNSFEQLKAEAAQFAGDWRMVLASSLTGSVNAAPEEAAIDQALERMVANIKAGQLANMIAFDAQGEAMALQ
ncbi:MAG: ribonucleotide reductase subunit alpha [Comamonadaceae bacterium CG_4_9_14_0_8_um_filter_60_18]|nr:MAG: ribonucleotide reductase subunit alpha [Comamonadaceae bacterium CG2_30_60_41]PIW06796.1 MAG: ribonucleotide reductase subunit alpha [Comamonadaceae bacterium CG17_big_fil_post_rev_8_21_14_2_50_60_13]PJC11550.1 MAG: ribonucleotide reductase subunit alpha [Comamonadaceae bacterium CG_4_9_14_0_8_um_filter_60_18]